LEQEGAREDASNGGDAAGGAAAGTDDGADSVHNNADNTNTNTDNGDQDGPRLKYLCAPYDDFSSSSSTSTTANLKPRGKFLSYSYDVHVRTTTHVLEAGAEYEAAMVGYLAKRLGLDGCTGGGGGEGGGRRLFRLPKSGRAPLRRRSLQEGEVKYEDDVPVVVGISAEPRDMPNYEAECNEHYLGVPTKCYHMNGSLALYFRPDAPDAVVQAEAETVLRLISRGMVEDRFATTSIPIAVFVEGGVMGDSNSNGSNNSDEKEVEVEEIGGDDSNTNNADGGNDNDATNANSPTVPVVPEVDGGGGVGGSIFAPSNPGIASVNKDPASTAADGGSGGGGGGGPSSTNYAVIGGAIAAVALAAVLGLLVRRRRRNLANKYSLREVGGGGAGGLPEDSPEISADGVVIVDKSKSHRKSNSHSSHNFSDGTYGESPTLPNTPSSFEDPDDDGGYQEAVELGLTDEAAAATAAIAEAAAASAHRRTGSRDSHGSGFYTAAQSVQKTRSAGSNTTVGAENMSPIQQQLGGGGERGGAEDDANSVGSDESGVTIELDMNRVNSTVSEITWAGPHAQREASAAANILNRFPPYKSLYSGPNPGAIVEEEDDDFDENDEDFIGGGGSAASQRSTGGSTDFGSVPAQRMM